MSILASLAHAYDRLPDAPPFGFSAEKIGFLLSLNEDGAVAHVIDLREGEGRKRQPRMIAVPASFKRPGTTPRAFFLWDNTAFALGVSAEGAKDAQARHEAFQVLHFEKLKDSDDPGLSALLKFLDTWEPGDFVRLGWPEEMRGQNVVFALESERRERFLHDRPAARAIWTRVAAENAQDAAVCLVTGETAPVARLHPAIKGVWGGQVAGGSIVSFNLDAFESYGHEQGDNAPVSEAAAFAYTTALNRFLARDSGHRVQIGDASTVFWADAADMAVAEEAEGFFAALIDTPGGGAAEDAAATRAIGVKLERIRAGASLAEVEPRLAEGVRFHVLGLAPNAARLSIRFYWEDDFGTLTANYQRFLRDLAVEPGPRDGYPPLWRYLVELAAQGKRENVPPNLAGEWMRAILNGTPYPRTLLTATLMRIRADGAVNALRAGMLKAVLVRNSKREVPVALDPEERNKGYVLGRLFAVYEEMQRGALGSLNASVKDKFYASASATPRKVFARLEAGSANHLAKLRKQKPGREVNLQKLLGAIMDRMEPGQDPYPASLSAEEQALFGLGYHHQHSDFFKARAGVATETEGKAQ